MYVYIHIYIYIYHVRRLIRCLPIIASSARLKRIASLSILAIFYPPSEIDLGLFWADFTDLEGKHLFHRIGRKGRIWQLCFQPPVASSTAAAAAGGSDRTARDRRSDAR